MPYCVSFFGRPTKAWLRWYLVGNKTFAKFAGSSQLSGLRWAQEGKTIQVQFAILHAFLFSSQTAPAPSSWASCSRTAPTPPLGWTRRTQKVAFLAFYFFLLQIIIFSPLRQSGLCLEYRQVACNWEQENFCWLVAYWKKVVWQWRVFKNTQVELTTT